MEFYELINKIQANMMEYYIKPVTVGTTTMHCVMELIFNYAVSDFYSHIYTVCILPLPNQG
jgi:hypothetical protein